MNKILEWVVQSRAGGRVERGHGLPHFGSYNNAAHSWGVAMLMWYLWPDDFPRLAIYCLAHDVPEAWVGDVPAPTGRYVQGLKESLGAMEDSINCNINLPAMSELNAEDHQKLKACDKLELYLWCREQQNMGNQFIEETLKELDHFFSEEALPSPADQLYRDIQDHNCLPIQSGIIRNLA